ncbi:MAG TPA: FKBP-type peptidyl-prolyl cis-trans isomerase [Longimicrobium sp.]|nr:FKBP-type peptidyl-prolyl cis-trans isomerase [Longimicrobium sp.]
MKLKTLFAVAAATLLTACLGDATGSGTVTIPPLVALPAGTQIVTTQSGLQYADITVGSGNQAAAGKQVAVHYTGWLSTGPGFDTSSGRSPLTFTIGGHQLLAAFEEGVIGMRVGGKRRLILKPELAYGANDIKDQTTGKVIIPANSTIVFDISLVALQAD